MRKKRTMALLLALALLALSSCGDKGQTEEVASPVQLGSGENLSRLQPKEIENDNPAEEEDSRQNTKSSIPSNPASFTFELNGTVYSIPATFDEFARHGWEIIESDRAQTLSYGQKMYSQLVMDNYKVQVAFQNYGMDTAALGDCHINEIEFVSGAYGVDTPEITLPGGLSWDSSSGDLVAAYGEPDELSANSVLDSYLYEFETSNSMFRYSSIRVSFDADDNKLYKIALSHPVEPNMVQESAWDGSIPEAVANYQPPAKVSADWKDYTFQLEGGYYNLQAPLSLYLERGWKIARDEDILEQMIPSGTALGALTLEKSDVQIRVSIENPDMTSQPAGNCIVNAITLYSDEGPAQIELAGGITMKSSNSDVEKALGSPSDFSEEGNILTYGYEDRPVGWLWFSFDKTDGSIRTITYTGYMN